MEQVQNFSLIERTSSCTQDTELQARFFSPYFSPLNPRSNTDGTLRNIQYAWCYGEVQLLTLEQNF